MVSFRDNPCLPLRILRYFPRIYPPSILDALLHIQISDRYTPHNHVHVHQHRASFTSNSHTTPTTNNSLHCIRASISQIAFIYTHSAHSFICHRLTDISRHLFDRHTTYNNGIFSHLRYLPPPHLPLYHAILYPLMWGQRLCCYAGLTMRYPLPPKRHSPFPSLALSVEPANVTDVLCPF